MWHRSLSKMYPVTKFILYQTGLGDMIWTKKTNNNVIPLSARTPKPHKRATFDWILYAPFNNFSVMWERVFLGRTRTKQG